MQEDPRKRITTALHLIQQEVSLEANRLARFRSLLAEYLPHVSLNGGTLLISSRLRMVEAELRRFAAGVPPST